MKIQYALMSCNANPRYIAYWPTVASAWLKLDITPVLLFIPDNPSVRPPDLGIVHTIPPLNDVHIMPQVLMVRFWASYLYPNATLTISDMDYIPLSKHFFCNQLMTYPDQTYIHLNPNSGYEFCSVSNIAEKTTSLNKLRYLQASFHLAKGEVMHDVLELSPDWETTCKKIAPYYLHKKAAITTDLYSWETFVGREGYAQGDVPWCGDEIYTSLRLHHSTYQPIYYLSDQAGLINWDTVFPLGMDHSYRVFNSINSLAKWHRKYHRNKEKNYNGIHLSRSSYEESKNIIEHLLAYREVPRPSLAWHWYVRSWNALIHFTYAMRRVEPVGVWLSFVLNALLLLVVRIPFLARTKLHKTILIRMLHNSRTKLLARIKKHRIRYTVGGLLLLMLILYAFL